MPPPSATLACLLKTFWNTVTFLGIIRPSTRFLRRFVPVYRDTMFFFEHAPQGYVALTIDDGLSRGGPTTSLVWEVCELLHSYKAHATFFVCSQYTTAEEARLVLDAGHELGNHMPEALNGFYYFKLDKDQFQHEFQKVNDILDEMDGGAASTGRRRRWFRAPQARMNVGMRDTVNAAGMRHVLGDVYCDDWAYPNGNSNRHVAPLMLRQLHRHGSIAVFHMPERGYSESFMDALEAFLEGTTARGLQCITLSEMENLQTSTRRR